MQSKSVHLSVVNIGSCPSPLPKIFKLGRAAATQICLEQKLVMKLLKILWDDNLELKSRELKVGGQYALISTPTLLVRILLMST